MGSESHSERLHAQLKPRDTAIYFARDQDGKAWYTKAGIDTNWSPCPFVWLQTGAPTVTGEPHICISFESALKDEMNVSRLSAEAFPRQREPLEAFNGSVNYALVKSWLRKCCAEHVPQCRVEDTVSALRLDIYLVDVKARKLVRHSTGDRFVALSYVWGKQSQRSESITTINGDAASSNEIGGRRNPDLVPGLPATLPQTMEDAIRFVDHIGERFLWIDQLCIDQTEDEQKQEQINVMDQIFTSAHLTLVSLDGPNADWGLPGVSRPLLQTHQPTVRLDQGRLMATFIYSNWDNNGNSIWDSRGWTLQERLLSRRCIFFAKTHISMTCRTEFFHDCLAMNPAGKGVKTWLGDDYFREDGSGINLDDTEWDFKTYDALVSVFTGRNLTYEADVLNACQGSLNRISHKAGIQFSFGLPMSDCLRALVWVPHHAHVLARRRGFPSWSWTGWTGRIEYQYWVGDMAAYVDEDPRKQLLTQSSTLKRKRFQHPETKYSHLERARVIRFPIAETHTPSLTLEMTTTKFKLRLVRRDGEPLRKLRPSTQQSKTAIGDHWALISEDGNPLRDHAGEYPHFEVIDFFFRVKSEYSEMLLAQRSEADLLFVEHWPRIRDSEASNKWLYDMVSALVVVRNVDGTAWRLASVLLKSEEWYGKNPRPEMIRLV